MRRVGRAQEERARLLAEVVGEGQGQRQEGIHLPAYYINDADTSPWVWAQAAVLVAGAVLAGTMVRRRGAARGVAALAWIAGVVAGLAVTGPDPESALVASAASGVVVLGWAVRPWRFLTRGASPGPSATLPKAL